MRQELLTGFVLHTRAYKEKSEIIYFFSKEHGVVHGVGKVRLGAFQPMQTYASGSRALKRFAGFDSTGSFAPLRAQALYAGMYLNELFMRALEPEDVLYHSFFAYAHAIEQLSQLQEQNLSDSDFDTNLNNIKIILRTVEYNLLAELGFGMDFSQDAQGKPIKPDALYVYEVEKGLVIQVNATTSKGKKNILGRQLLSFNARHICSADCTWLGVVCRANIDHLLGYKPLKSRELWLSLHGK